MDQIVFIVFPKGDKTRLAFGIGFDYEKDDWCLASRRTFSYSSDGQLEALTYAKELARNNNLTLDVSGLDSYIQQESHFLD